MIWALVAHAANFQIDTGIPGPLSPSGSGGGILGFIQNAYLFALGIAGLLALGSIVWGAIQYTTSRGNPSKLNDAWDRIVQALIGILLLVGAGTLLSIVNPGLLSLQLPELARVGARNYQLDVSGTVPMTYEDGDTGADTTYNPTNIPATASCKTDPSKCVSLKAAGFTCAATRSPSCSAHEQIQRVLTCAAQKLGIKTSDIRITEAYPPDSTHQDPRHNNGCSVDTTLSKAAQQGGCDRVREYANAINSCGGSSLNEYVGKDSFSGIDYSNCQGAQKPKYWGGNNVHVNGCPRGTQ